jgi:hypothetical protein
MKTKWKATGERENFWHTFKNGQTMISRCQGETDGNGKCFMRDYEKKSVGKSKIQLKLNFKNRNICRKRKKL